VKPAKLFHDPLDHRPQEDLRAAAREAPSRTRTDPPTPHVVWERVGHIVRSRHQPSSWSSKMVWKTACRQSRSSSASPPAGTRWTVGSRPRSERQENTRRFGGMQPRQKRMVRTHDDRGTVEGEHPTPHCQLPVDYSERNAPLLDLARRTKVASLTCRWSASRSATILIDGGCWSSGQSRRISPPRWWIDDSSRRQTLRVHDSDKQSSLRC
jgi:hypothetical protein